MNDASEQPRPDAGEAQADTPCPICARPVRASAETFPFCSTRCRYVDLGRWLDGKYRISRPHRDDAAQP
ncbi:MAG: DNA gyrase inhibitor YacG [Planctomycetota bacterium]